MKHLLLISTMLVILYSCKKEIITESGDNLLMNKIKHQLKDSLSINDFKNLDFVNAVSVKEIESDFSILKIPFIYNTTDANFVLLRVKKDQSYIAGKIIELTRNQSVTISLNHLKFEGDIKNLFMEKKPSIGIAYYKWRCRQASS